MKGGQFVNVNDGKRYIVDDIVQVAVTSHTDFQDVYVVHSVETDAVERWSHSLFWQHFRPAPPRQRVRRRDRGVEHALNHK